MQLDVEVGPGSQRPKVGLLGFLRAQKNPLRKRWSLVGRVRLRPDQHDSAIEALVAQRLGGASAREVRPDDRERVSHAR